MILHLQFNVFKFKVVEPFVVPGLVGIGPSGLDADEMVVTNKPRGSPDGVKLVGLLAAIDIGIFDSFIRACLALIGSVDEIRPRIDRG